MNHFLVQGFVEAIISGSFNDYTKGGIYLFSNTPSRAPCAKGILEVIPSATSVVQRVTAIGASDEAVTGAIFLRSAHKVGNAWSWDADWITVSTSGGTITIIDTVTQGSNNPVTSNGIYNFVQSAIIAPHDPYAEVYITCTDGILSAAPVLKFQGWTNSVPGTVSELVTDNDFKTTLKNVVHIYINNVFCGEGLLFAEEGISQSGTATVSTKEVQVYFPSTVPFTQNNSTTYYEGVSGKLTYSSSDWHLGGYQTSGNISSFIAPDWSDILMQANAYTDSATHYTNANATTLTVGGIPAGTTFNNKSLTDIIEDLLYPYVAFTFSSFTTTAASGTFEYGTAKSITAVKPTYTKGSKNLTNMKVGTTSGGSNLYNSSVPNSGTSVSLSTPLQLDGLSNQTIYTTITDGTTTTTKSVTFSFPYYYYWANTSSTTTPGSLSAANVIRGGSDADGDVSGVQTDNNSYLFFFVPSGQNKSQIQQYAMSQWNNVDTISVGTVTFLTSTNQSVTTYKAYRTSMLVAGSGNRFRIN